jgi:hypothetical protein
MAEAPERVEKDTLMFDLLMHACPARAVLREDGSAANEYYIETHCVGYMITATPKYHDGTVTAFLVWNVKKEDC